MSDRREQIEALAKAFEAHGDGRQVRFWEAEDLGDHKTVDRYDFWRGPMYTKGSVFVGTIKVDGNDTDDMTPCGAILRNVLGEDWTISEWTRNTVEGPARSWKSRPLATELDAKCNYISELSRIDSVTLALAKEGL